MITVLIPVADLDGESARLEGRAYHHYFRARRLAVGERLRVTDGAGRARWATIDQVVSTYATIVLAEPAPANESPIQVELMVASPRPQRATWLVEKSTEIGVTAIHFFNSARSPRAYGQATLERLRRVAAAAVEQANRSVIPRVSGMHAWDEIVSLAGELPAGWFLDTAPRHNALSPGKQRGQAVMVGPEGGWTAVEVEELAEAGLCGAYLGPRRLRVETAAVVAAATLIDS